MRLPLVLLILLSLTACGPKPPETMLNDYFNALFVQGDRPAALVMVKQPAGVAVPERVAWIFKNEEPFVSSVEAYFVAEHATEAGTRRSAWSKLRREKLFSMERQHTTSTTATVAVRVEPELLAKGGAKDPKPLELEYVLLRDEQQVWHINEVRIRDRDTGNEFTVGSHEAQNEESKNRKDTDPWH